MWIWGERRALTNRTPLSESIVCNLRVNRTWFSELTVNPLFTVNTTAAFAFKTSSNRTDTMRKYKWSFFTICSIRDMANASDDLCAARYWTMKSPHSRRTYSVTSQSHLSIRSAGRIWGPYQQQSTRRTRIERIKEPTRRLPLVQDNPNPHNKAFLWPATLSLN